MAGHGSPPAPDRANDPARQVGPGSGPVPSTPTSPVAPPQPTGPDYPGQ